MTASVEIRPANESDTPDLAAIRRDAILVLAAPMLGEQPAQQWAESSGDERVLRAIDQHDVWVAERDGVSVGWVEVDRGRIEGLYVRAEVSGEGIGSALLSHGEREIRSAGFVAAALDASPNAEAFYLRRGYQAQLDSQPERSTDAGLPMRKRLGPIPNDPMLDLSSIQKDILSELVERLSRIDGIEAIALGGSYARGRAQVDSDIDLGIYYRDAATFSIAEVRSLCAELNDEPNPVVAEFGEWGPWVDGGAWLTIQGQRVDLLYRSLDKIDRTILAAEQGDFELHYGQQPPFGFFGPTYLGEVFVAVPLLDTQNSLASRKARVVEYPEALRASIVQDCLWAVDFGLAAFAPKFARRADPYGTAGCLTRFIYQLVLVLFALNRTYLLNDKTALPEVDEFPIAPDRFRSRVHALLSQPGASVESLETAVGEMQRLFQETVELAGKLYRPNRSP